MASLILEGHIFGNGGRVLVIAEIGTAHSGSIEKAKDLVRAARDAGADSAKFQMVYADEILHPDTGFVPLPGGPVSLYERFRSLELPVDFYREMAGFCEECGLLFLCTPFGVRSARELATLRPPAVKIASPELNHLPLLRETAAMGVPLILSTGVSRLSDIERALELTSQAPARALLHCVTSYPAPETDYNLRTISSLSGIFGPPCGVSDHSLDPVLVPVLATAVGAVAIEKHICLSRSDPGLDDPVAQSPADFARMVSRVREAEREGAEGAIGRLSREFGRDRVEATLGDGVKTLAPSERGNYGRTNRSIHYLRAARAGEAISERDVALLRTEKKLSPGIGPEWMESVLGGVLARDVENGAGVSWDDFISR